jgi:hypothetical protein
METNCLNKNHKLCLQENYGTPSHGPTQNVKTP